MKRTFILFLSTFSLLISGCNLDLIESENSNKLGEIITVNQAQIAINSETHYQVFEGQINENNPPVERYTDVISYTVNESIANQSGYQAIGEGPFFTITNRRFSNSQQLSSYASYINNSGEIEFSINDRTYANQYDMTFSSERDASSSTYQIGKSYTTKGSQRRYDKDSHNLQLISQSKTVYTPKKLETLSISSGVFDTLRIDFIENSEINNIYRSDVLFESNGSQWIDIATGKIIQGSVKTTMYDAGSYGTEYEQSITFISERYYLFDQALANKEIESQSSNFVNLDKTKGKSWHHPTLL